MTVQANILGFPILSLITFIPLAGALLLLFVGKEQVRAQRNLALLFSLVTFAVSLWLPANYDASTAAVQFPERASWIPSIGVTYFMGLDGISLWLVMLTTFLSPIAILCSYQAIHHRTTEYYIFLLILETGMLGVFVSLDLFLFYVFWEVMLVPMYFLIGVWGSDRRLYSAIKFFLYTLFGSVVMLLGILAVYFYAGAQTGKYTFDVLELMRVAYPNVPLFTLLGVPFSFQDLVWLAFALSFAIKVPMFPFHTWLPDAHTDAPTAGSVILAGVLLKMGTYGFLRFNLPMFPFHTWLPDAHTDAPTAGSVILAGVLLKMGTYGFLRFNLPMFPEASLHFVPLVFTLAIVAIIYGALVCMIQPDMKRLIAYSSVSHMGFVMLGMFALNLQGMEGSLLQMINHGLSTGGLFLVVGIIYDRRHTRQISELGGISRQMPIYATLFAIIMFSSMGLPGLNGFVGEFLILIGAFQVRWWWGALAVTGIVLGAAYMLWLYQRTMFGEITKEENKKLQDLSPREMATLLPIIALCFWIGLYPAPFLRSMTASVENVLQIVEKGAAGKAVRAKQAALGQPAALGPLANDSGLGTRHSALGTGESQ
jgi:NADH-quinone oxidoreductase subunit M